MVLMLRSRGIPARLATGFLGAEYNPLEDYYIVRQSNAHAWVEAFLPRPGLDGVRPDAARRAAGDRPDRLLPVSPRPGTASSSAGTATC